MMTAHVLRPQWGRPTSALWACNSNLAEFIEILILFQEPSQGTYLYTTNVILQSWYLPDRIITSYVRVMPIYKIWII